MTAQVSKGRGPSLLSLGLVQAGLLVGVVPTGGNRVLRASIIEMSPQARVKSMIGRWCSSESR